MKTFILISVLFFAASCHAVDICGRDIYDQYFAVGKDLMTTPLFGVKLSNSDSFTEALDKIRTITKSLPKCLDKNVDVPPADCQKIFEIFNIHGDDNTDCTEDDADLIFKEIKEVVLETIEETDFDATKLNIQNYQHFANELTQGFMDLAVKCAQEQAFSWLTPASKECAAIFTVVKVEDVLANMPAPAPSA